MKKKIIPIVKNILNANDQIAEENKANFDTKNIRSDDIKYTLKNVKWDYNSDWDIDEEWKKVDYSINAEWSHTVTVTYVFAHRIRKDDIIELKETILIEWIKKDAILNIAIEKESDYAPITVKFDASKSQVKDENIALNLMVSFLQLGHKRGAYSLEESSKIWECVKMFVKAE